MSVIDDHLANVPAEQRAVLEHVRQIILKAVPAADAQETIGYGMPVIRYKNKYLIGFDAFKDHMSVFPGADTIAALQDQLGEFAKAKGTVQFTLENPLPDDVLTVIVKQRIAEIDG